MSLTDTINNTNTQKDNLKTVANNIDNKLVELGGERATDLADVANKMEGMVTTQYVKIAEGEYNSNLSVSNRRGTSGGHTWVDLKLPLNLEFIPKRLIVHFYYMNEADRIELRGLYMPYMLSLDSKFNFNTKTAGGMGEYENVTKVFIKKITKTEAILSFTSRHSDNSYVINKSFYMAQPIKWTAIG